MCEHETFWTLLKDAAHWEFEIFLIVLIDGLILGLFWPFIRKHVKHHKCPEPYSPYKRTCCDTISEADAESLRGDPVPHSHHHCEER